MIEPISLNFSKKCGINFKGQDNNFKGIGSASSLPEVQSLSAREAYSQAVNTAEKTQKEFVAPAGVGENLNIVG